MTERAWKLGEDLYPEDSLLDGVTLDDLITAVRCNCRVLTTYAVRAQWANIWEQRKEDAEFILENNINEIIDTIRKEREEA